MPPVVRDLEIVSCPTCTQKLALPAYFIVGTRIVCANANCDTTLRVVSREPARVEVVPEADQLNADSAPESYG